MKTLKRILLFSFGIPISLLLLYGLVKFIIIPFWEPILFYLFILCALLYSMLILITLIRINKVNPFSKDFIWDSFTQQIQNANKVIVLRSVITKIFAPFIFISHWISFLIIGFLIRKNINYAKGKYTLLASGSIEKPEHYHSIITFILVLLTAFIINISNLEYSYHKYFLIIIIIGILSKELSYVFSIQSLPEILKKTLGNPYLKFFQLLIFDFLALSLAYALLRSITTSVHISYTLYLETITGLFRLQKVQELFNLGSLTIDDWFLSIGGLIFYLSLFKSILSYKEFKRKDSDIIVIASKYLQAGNFYLCQKWLKKVVTNTPDRLLYECACFMGLNQMEKAFLSAEKRIKIENDKPTSDEIYSQVYGMLLYAPVPLEFITNLISFSIKQKVSDARLTTSIMFIVISNGLLFENESLFDEIDFIGEGYLLSQAFLFINSFEINEALVLLKDIKTKSPFEELIRIYLIQYTVVFSEYDSKEEKIYAYKNWLDEYYDKINISVNNLIDDGEKLSISAFIMESASVCKVLLPYREQEFKYLADTLLSDINEQKFPKLIIDTLKSMSLQIEKKMGEL